MRKNGDTEINHFSQQKREFYDEFENTITMLHKNIDSKSQTEAMLGLAEQVFICSM